jgi:hypothetical protein
VKQWEQYQHHTAELLRELGFITVVNDQLRAYDGAVHNIDVSARIMIAGVPVIWIVECKHWNRRVNQLHVSALKDIVNDLAADRGVLISKNGFQPGAIRVARSKNITLTSLEELRGNAVEDLLTARVHSADWRLLHLSRTIVWDLRTFTGGTPHLLAELVNKISPQDRAEFAARDTAADFAAGIAELASRAGVTSPADLVPLGSGLLLVGRTWKHGVDPATMSALATAISHLSQALSQGKLGDWPVTYPPVAGTPKLAWSMKQLISVVEAALDVLEPEVAAQKSQLR